MTPVDLLEEARPRIADGSLAAFRVQLDRIAGCTRPIRISGRSLHVDLRTGEIRPFFESATQPDGTILIPCGNRRASVCPSCSWTYAGDAWQIVHTGLAGGRGIPEAVIDHPGLFVTVTAPSFGPVHTRNAKHGQDARTCHRLKGFCPHGKPRGCWAVHDAKDDPQLGQALCLDCYDYLGAVIWNAIAARLFKRTVDLCYRRLAHIVGVPLTSGIRKDGSRRVGIRELLRISYVKVAEMQARSLIHFHGILRLDGFSPIPGDYPPPPDWATGKLLARAWRWAVEQVSEPCPTPAAAGLAAARWGEQHHERHLTVAGGVELDDTTTVIPDGPLSARAVGNYLAKYVTKGVTDSGVLDQPIRTSDDLRLVLPLLTGHQAAMVRTAWYLGGPVLPLPGQPARALAELRLRQNAHQFGFRGHWLTKSRVYSLTFGACRTERREWQRTHDAKGNPRTPLDAWGRPLEADTGDEVLTIGEWRFEGAGYRLSGDAQLAAMAADLARSRREAARADRAAA
ncbi:replication initiator [Pseudofrankia sp. DC12]|uniref:replication initiator n=1 Tax=Pseudofrankia sp. DC12 TaxID=683315 RepID=UPI000698D02F|nr:replication initiator [Pseudofrankia sp. DC12]